MGSDGSAKDLACGSRWRRWPNHQRGQFNRVGKYVNSINKLSKIRLFGRNFILDSAPDSFSIRSHLQRMEVDVAYVVFAEEIETGADISTRTVETLEQAFAQILCRCGYNYSFERRADGWALVLTDVERPELSPEAILTTYSKVKDAQYDLMSQSIDGRLKGHIALDLATIRGVMVEPVRSANGRR